MRTWPATALECLVDEPTAMITLAAIEGSTPREAGARMIVTPTQAHGTVGGGNLEFLLIDQARRLLASDLDVLQQDYPLGPLLAQCCGGRVRVLVERLAAGAWLTHAADAETTGEPYTLTGAIHENRITRTSVSGWLASATEGAFLSHADGFAHRRSPWSHIVEHIRPAATHLSIYGAGHVGRALAHIAETLPFRLRWYDTRPELTGADPRLTVLEDLAAPVLTAPAGAFHVVLTHAHELDYQIVRAILQRGDAGYCGLIGSATKRARFLSRLAKDGIDSSGLTCPIGAGLIRSKLPAAIAVAASAELLTQLEKATAAQAPALTHGNPERDRSRA
jgi:xanthine dehydrogenase accessory factor